MGIQPKDGLLRIRRILKVRWVLFVDDEVQMRFILTGRLFAMEHFGASQKRLILLEDCYHLIAVDKKKREVADATVLFLEELIQSKVIC